MLTVTTKSFILPKIDDDEVLRYVGAKDNSRASTELLAECLPLAKDFATSVTYGVFPLHLNGNEITVNGEKTVSASLAKHLYGCEKAVIFAATVGTQTDRLIMKYSKTEPSRALTFQAIGTERIEALCDEFCAFVQNSVCKDNESTTSRFSPGYGDFDLGFQRNIFRLLSPEKSIGLTLNDSLIMSPSKSVTAIIGISGKCNSNQEKPCENCTKTNCEFRR